MCIRDRVGHTGDIHAAIKAVETVDSAVGRLAEAVSLAGAAMLVTADHGNCEVMWDSAANRHILRIQQILCRAFWLII